jgi:hypothetical protein
MWPRRRRRIAGSTALIIATAPKTFTSNWWISSVRGLHQRAGRCCLAVAAVDWVEVERSIMSGLIKPAAGT